MKQEHMSHIIFKKIKQSALHSLVDRREYGGAAGNDVSIIENHPDRKVDIRGIDNHEITSAPLVTAEGVTCTTSGEVIVITHQHACHGENATIHFSVLIEHCKNAVDDKLIRVGGTQSITTLDNCKIPISIRNDLPHMAFRPCTNDEWDALSHVILASDKDWDPTSLDCKRCMNIHEWVDAQPLLGPHDKDFNKVDNHRHRSNLHQSVLSAIKDQHLLDHTVDAFITACNIDVNSCDFTTKDSAFNYELLRPLFNWKALDMIKKTFELSIKHARAPPSAVIKTHAVLHSLHLM